MKSCFPSRSPLLSARTRSVCRGVKERFRNEVHFWRCLHSVMASLILQVFLTPVALVLLQFNLFCPLDGFAVWWTSFVESPWYHIRFLGAGFLIAAYHAICITVAPVVHRTRLARAICLVHPRNLNQALLRALAGGLFVHALLGILGGSYGHLQRDCVEPFQFECLSESHVFLVLHGAFTGISLHMAQLAASRFCLTFPPIQAAWMRTHLRLWQSMRQSAWDTFRKAHIFYALYFLFGAAPKRWIVGDVDPNQWVGQLHSVWGLLDLGLFHALLVTGAAVRTLDQLAVQVRDYCLTKVYQFPIVAEYEAEVSMQMSVVMTSTRCALLKYLSFLDFRHLAEYSARRRAQVFTVSPIGHHARHWNNLCGACLDLASQFTQALQQVKVASAAGTKRTAPPPLCAPQTLSRVYQAFTALKSKPLVVHFTSELPDINSRQLFADCQPLIWAVEGLGLLALASQKEDGYQVVPSSLPSILDALLELDQVLERQSATLRHSSSDWGRELQLAKTLKAVVTTSIYQITLTFRNMRKMDLASENRKWLQQYLDFAK